MGKKIVYKSRDEFREKDPVFLADVEADEGCELTADYFPFEFEETIYESDDEDEDDDEYDWDIRCVLNYCPFENEDNEKFIEDLRNKMIDGLSSSMPREYLEPKEPVDKELADRVNKTFENHFKNIYGIIKKQFVVDNEDIDLDYYMESHLVRAYYKEDKLIEVIGEENEINNFVNEIDKKYFIQSWGQE